MHRTRKQPEKALKITSFGDCQIPDFDHFFPNLFRNIAIINPKSQIQNPK
jgi:hypothetical protein